MARLIHFPVKDESPIITSLLDIDFYKFTMGQLAFKRYPDVPVTYAFKNRTKRVCLAGHIDLGELREELDHVRTLQFNKSELHYLRGTNEYRERMFGEDYLQFLANLRLPSYQLAKGGGDLFLEFSGNWAEAIYWETIALTIINELYYRSILKGLSWFERNSVFATGQLRLSEKIKRLKERPEITFCDFGTRRRFSKFWQDYVAQSLASELPSNQFLGTSNTYLAMKYGLLPMGTSAHELFMVMAGLMADADGGILQATGRVLRDWWEEYGWGLSIALTDTFGTDFFFRIMTQEQARDWKGLRQDSGDPIEFGEKAIAFYDSHGVNPREKLIVFSDGLDVDLIFKIADRFRNRIRCTFGWGTNLTNDLGFPALSLVIKTVRAAGRGLVKLSDNLAKAIGQPADVERYKEIFGYTGNRYEECRY